MTEATKMVLDEYQVRKNKAQKRRFAAFAQGIAEKEGYSFKVEGGCLGAKNLVVGDPERADVVFGAHYDTCAVLPFPNFVTPENIFIYLLYQVALVLVLFLPMVFIQLGLSCLLENAPLTEKVFDGVLLVYAFTPAIWGILVVSLILFGPANKHTVNDNTSGVTVLLELMQAMPPELRGRVAFIFFDFEEAGLLGSMQYRLKHGKSLKNTPVVNFDCVSDGRDVVILPKGNSRSLAPLFARAFTSTAEVDCRVALSGYFYPSDQASFKAGVGVAAFKRTKGGLLYMDRIHTPKDTVYREENIEFLVSGSVRFAELIAAEKGV